MPETTFAEEPASTEPAPFESWGRYPTYPARIVPLNWQNDFPAAIADMHNGALPVGMGRSYGDSCLLKGGNLLLTTGMNRLLHFDAETGILTAESGATLAQILDFAVPRGFFLPVSPGTKYVTLGGAIANDIHGKNHHVAGTFGSHVTEFELVRSDGSRRLCSPTENLDYYSATIGGLGLTGVITWAKLRMKPIVSRGIDYEGIQYHGVDEFLDLTRQSEHIEYTVSWIDCASTGKNFARGVFMQGDHSKVPAELKPSPEPKLVFPFDAPGFALNHTTVSLFNTAFFHKQLKPRVTALQDYEPFFYPLDKVLHWNRMYGRNGLLQFQYAIPWESAREGTIAILQEVAKSGLASFLAVLKVFGDVPSPGMMSFPQPGVTLALDFPIKADKSFPLFERLADMTRRLRRQTLSCEGCRHDRRAVSGLLPSVGELRPLSRPHAYLQLLGARHRRSTDRMSTSPTPLFRPHDEQYLRHQEDPCTRRHLRQSPRPHAVYGRRRERASSGRPQRGQAGSSRRRPQNARRQLRRYGGRRP